MRANLLVPGVQHRQEADVGSDAARVGGQSEQGFRDRLEQDVIDPAWILEGQQRKLVRQRESDMGVGHRQ